MKVIIQTQDTCIQCPKEIILRVKKTSKISSVLSFISKNFDFPVSHLTLTKDSQPLDPGSDCSILKHPNTIILHSLFPRKIFEDALNEIKLGSNESFLTNFFEALNLGFSLDKVIDEKGWSLIHYSCLYGNALVTSNLLASNEKSINLCTRDGWTPLMIAADKGFKSVIMTLLSVKKLKINLVTCQGTALHRAVSNCNTEIVKILINNKADIKTEDFSHRTCMEIPASSEILEIIPVLYGQRQALKNFCLDSNTKFEFQVLRATKRFTLDYQCRISVNFTTGRFEEHLITKSSYYLVFKKKLLKLQEMHPINSEHRDRFYFDFNFPNETLKYWTDSEDVRDRIIQSFQKALSICRWKELGIRDYSEPEEFQSKKSVICNLNIKQQKTVKISEFERIRIIGSGSFGKVYLIKHKTTEELFALKTSERASSPKGRTKFAITECEILKSVTHPFIVKLYWAIATPRHLNLILEYCESDLSKVLGTKGKLNESEARFVLASVCLGLKHLHLKGIVCRDLKPANILLESSGYFKLCDFGLSQNRVQGEKINAKLMGSPTYLSPEGISNHKVGKISDIWTLGVVGYQILTGNLPFYAMDYESLYLQILEKKIKYPQYISQVGKEFLKFILNRDHSARPNIEQVMEHQFFKGLDWKLFLDKKYEPPGFVEEYLKVIKGERNS